MTRPDWTAPGPRSGPNRAETRLMRTRRCEAAREGRSFVLRWEWVPLEHISADAAEAVIAHVDPRFYVHGGFDVARIRHAWRANRTLGQRAAGGSSITTQLAKNLHLSLRKTYMRKLLEVPLTLWLEGTWGKRRILETYLNIAEWGEGIFGIEAAARSFFGIPAAELNLPQACALSAVLPNPRVWSPVEPSYYTRSLAELIRRRVMAQRQ